MQTVSEVFCTIYQDVLGYEGRETWTPNERQQTMFASYEAGETVLSVDVGQRQDGDTRGLIAIVTHYLLNHPNEVVVLMGVKFHYSQDLLRQVVKAISQIDETLIKKKEQSCLTLKNGTRLKAVGPDGQKFGLSGLYFNKFFISDFGIIDRLSRDMCRAILSMSGNRVVVTRL